MGGFDLRSGSNLSRVERNWLLALLLTALLARVLRVVVELAVLIICLGHR